MNLSFFKLVKCSVTREQQVPLSCYITANALRRLANRERETDLTNHRHIVQWQHVPTPVNATAYALHGGLAKY